MRSETIERLLLCCIAICAPLSIGWPSSEDLGRALTFLLLWSLGSTLLVGSAGAWVAIGRSLRARRGEAARAAAASGTR